MKFTGERFIPTEQGQIRLEHYHRYAVVLDAVKQKTVLDVACGEGYGSSLMADVAHTVVGVDISEEAVRHASSHYNKPNLKFFQGNATNLAFPDDSFDVVVSFETIEHLAEQEQMLAEIRRVLRPNGILIISSPNRTIYSEESGQHNQFHVKELDFQEFDELLRSQFPVVQYFGQRLLMSSVIQPLDATPSTSSVWSDNGSRLKANAGILRDPVYFLAVCGSISASVPNLGMSVFYPNSLDLLKHYVGFAKWAKSLEEIISERERQLTGLNQAVVERDRLIASLTQAVTERDALMASLTDETVHRGELALSLDEELGGFGEHYLPAYCKDSDLALKIRNKRFRVIYQPLASIIIPVYNKWEYTRQCLLSLEAEGYRQKAEVIVVDNASTDATATRLKSEFPWVEVIRNEQNLGFAKACNRGAERARGKYLVFLNNDTKVQKGWLEALVSFAYNSAKVGAVGAKLVYPNGRLQEAGGIVFSDGSCWNYGRGENPNDPRFNFIRRVDYCSGACLLVRADLFQKLGGFDSLFDPAYYEDVDLCFGIRDLGFEVYYQPEAVVIHTEGVTGGTDLTSGFKRYQVINRHKFVDKRKQVLQKQYPPDARWVRLASNRAPGKRIIVVDPFLPDYDRASGSRRLFEILKILVAQGHAVTFIARNGYNQERYAKDLRRLGIEVYSTDPEKLQAMGYFVSAPSIDLGRLLTESNYDLAWLSFYDIAEQYLPDIRRFSLSTQIYIDTVDVHFVREQREAELYQNKKLLRRAAETKLRELAIYRQADVLITVTEEDQRHLLAELPEAVVHTVPNVHDVHYDFPPFEERNGLLFIGNFRHRPNGDAVLYFVREILPRVRREIPEITLTVVGNAPPLEIQALAQDGIVVTGYVPDTLPYLQAHRATVAPLRYGAGLKGKVGEALAAGTPVITTSIGSEGMQLGSDQEILLVADDPETFAAAIVRAYTDKSLWQKLSQNGLAYVKEHYTPEVVAKRIEAILSDSSTFNDQNRVPSSASPRGDLSGSRRFTSGKPLLSIIIPVWKGATVTQRCLEAVVRYTLAPYEIIIIDNAADTETRSVIEAITARRDCNILLIHNSKNCGYPYACNQGIAMAKGDYIVIMNNDVIVTSHWATRMLAAFAVDPAIGIVGPRTNFAAGIQATDGCAYDEDSLGAWAERWYLNNAGSLRQVTRLIGFLWMMKREVVERIGGLDPLYGIGNFEDDDYCLRAQLSGYKLALAEDVFVHHYGSQSFKKNPQAYNHILQTNRMLFAAKWGINMQGSSYSVEEVIRRGPEGYNPADIYIPLRLEAIFSPGAAPLDVGARSRTGVLCIPDPSDQERRWLDVVKDYLRRYRPDAGLALIVRVEPNSKEWLNQVVSAIQQMALREKIDLNREDIIIEARPIPSSHRGSLYRAARYFVPLPGVRQEALLREAWLSGLQVVEPEV